MTTMSDTNGDGVEAPATLGEEMLLAGLDDGSLLIGDFMNVAHECINRAYAESRALESSPVTRQAKAMRKSWNRFRLKYNALVEQCREVVASGGEE